MWPDKVEKGAEYPPTEDEDENGDEGEDKDVVSRGKNKKKRDIDFKGDWNQWMNAVSAGLNDPGFSEWDPEERDRVLQRFQEVMRDFNKGVYKRKFN